MQHIDKPSQQSMKPLISLLDYITLRNEAEKLGDVKPVLSSKGGITVTYEEVRQTLNIILSDIYAIQASEQNKTEHKLVALISSLSDSKTLSDEDIKKLSGIYDRIDSGKFIEEDEEN